MAGFYETLERNIAKYGGADEAYKLKLKTGIRETLGYSNYMSQLKSALKAPVDLSLMKGNITPQGVKSLVGGAMDIKNQNVDAYSTMVGKVDAAAEGLAADRIAKERAAASAARSRMGLENGVAFSPESDLERRILEFMQNPKNPDGSTKSLQQLEAELNDYYEKNQQTSAKMVDASGNQIPYRVWSQEDVKSAIQKRIPQDYIGNEDKYFMMSQGYSAKQAEENTGALKYDSGLMSEPEKLIYETKNPAMAKLLQERKGAAQAINDATATSIVKDPATGQETTQPKYTFSELKKKYPLLTETELKSLSEPVYTKGAVEDIEAVLNESIGQKKPKKWLGMDWLAGDTEDIRKIDILKSVYNKEDPSDKLKEGGITSVQKTSIYQELKAQLEGDYGDVFTGPEIDRILFNNLMARF